LLLNSCLKNETRFKGAKRVSDVEIHVQKYQSKERSKMKTGQKMVKIHQWIKGSIKSMSKNMFYDDGDAFENIFCRMFVNIKHWRGWATSEVSNSRPARSFPAVYHHPDHWFVFETPDPHKKLLQKIDLLDLLLVQWMKRWPTLHKTIIFTSCLEAILLKIKKLFHKIF